MSKVGSRRGGADGGGGGVGRQSPPDIAVVVVVAGRILGLDQSFVVMQQRRLLEDDPVTSYRNGVDFWPVVAPLIPLILSLHLLLFPLLSGLQFFGNGRWILL